MIPESRFSPQTSDWKVALSESFRNIREFLDFCEVDANAVDSADDTDFSFRVTRFYASLIEKDNPVDPLLLQVLPQVQERIQKPGFVLDAVGDQDAMTIPGLIHKYQGRVLLTLTAACGIHCRYCFRRHFPYSDNMPDISQDGPVMSYLKRNADIHEVILSGGDPLMVSDEKIRQLVRNLNTLSHVRVLRVHTRLLSVLPERGTYDLVSALTGFRGRVVIVTHINHANEIAEPNRNLFLSLAAQGITLFNQSVLLKGVNDNSGTLTTLSHALFESGITPYYLHQLDRVQGAAHFETPTQQACDIVKELRQLLPGYLLPRMVREIPGQLSKSEVPCP